MRSEMRNRSGKGSGLDIGGLPPVQPVVRMRFVPVSGDIPAASAFAPLRALACGGRLWGIGRVFSSFFPFLGSISPRAKPKLEHVVKSPWQPQA